MQNKANMPALGRKSEILSSKSETTEFDEIHFEKTKPIYWRAELAQTIIRLLQNK